MIRAAIGLLILAGLAPAQEARPASFTFRNGFWTNLHHFLYVLGRARNAAPDSRREAVVHAPEDDGGLDAEERPIWDAAVQRYQEGLSKRDAVFDAELVRITSAVAAAGERLDGAAIPGSVREALERAAPVYRRAWWKRHAAANEARIEEQKKLLARNGNAISAIITRAYRQQWPAAGIRVEVAAYANWAGAYSTDGGLIVVASTDPSVAGTGGLETLFHEAMHQWDDAMAPMFRAAGAPRGLSHALIFYTAGYAVAKVVAGHRPYAESMWGERGMPAKSVMDAQWLPYLEGEGTLEEAVGKLAAAMRR